MTTLHKVRAVVASILLLPALAAAGFLYIHFTAPDDEALMAGMRPVVQTEFRREWLGKQERIDFDLRIAKSKLNEVLDAISRDGITRDRDEMRSELSSRVMDLKKLAADRDKGELNKIPEVVVLSAKREKYKNSSGKTKKRITGTFRVRKFKHFSGWDPEYEERTYYYYPDVKMVSLDVPGNPPLTLEDL